MQLLLRLRINGAVFLLPISAFIAFTGITSPSPLRDFTGVHCLVCETKHNASGNESVPIVR